MDILRNNNNNVPLASSEEDLTDNDDDDFDDNDSESEDNAQIWNYSFVPRKLYAPLQDIDIPEIDLENNGKPPPLPPGAPMPFDEALSQTKFGKLNYFIIFISGVVIAYALIETLGISYVLPVSQCDLNLTTQEKGALGAIGLIGIITSSHLWGFLADKYGRRKVIRPTLFMTTLLAILSSFSTNFWMLVILRYFTGFFVSGSSATIFAYLGEFHTNEKRSRAIMAASFVYSIIFATLPLIAMLVINQDWFFYIPFLDIMYKPWRLYLVVLSLPGLLCGLCLFWIPESPKFILAQGKEKECIEILQTIFSINTGKEKFDYKIESVIIDDTDISPHLHSSNSKSNPIVDLLKSIWYQTAPFFTKEYRMKTAVVCAIMFVTFSNSNGMYVWFPGTVNEVVKFMNENSGNHSTLCTIVSSSFVEVTNGNSSEMNCMEQFELTTFAFTFSLEVMYILSFAILSFIIKYGEILILFFILIASGLCGILAVFVDIPLVAIYLYAILILSGLGFSVMNAVTVDLYPTHLRAMAVCISLMMGRLGAVVGSNIAGVLFDKNCETTFLIAGISLIITGFLSILIPIRKKATKTKRSMSLSSVIGNPRQINTIQIQDR